METFTEVEVMEAAYLNHQVQQLQMIPAAAFLELFITSESQRNSFIDQVLSAVESGSINPMKAYIGVKALGKLVDSFTDKNAKTNKRSDAAQFFMDCVLTEAAHYGKKFELLGAKCEQKEVGVKYTYESCNDPMVIELGEQSKRLSEALKKRQDFLKTLPGEGLDILNSDTGETYKIYPPAKSSTTTLSVSI